MNKIYIKSTLVALFSALSFISSSQIITTLAGNGAPGFSGDGGPASSAELFLPYEVATDSVGNLYVADSFNNRIRKISTTGVITTIAGNGYGAPFNGGYSGDGGQASGAELYYPIGVALDKSGNIYISDYDNERIRKVNTSGIISTIAGNGTKSYSGDGGPATAAEINGPTGVTADPSGNVYIADYYNSRIRKVNPSGTITTLAGNGVLAYSGDGGPATAAELYQPSGMVADKFGSIYIADYDNDRVRVVNTSGIINTFAGNGVRNFSGDGGPASAAELSQPCNLFIDTAGNIFVVDYSNNRIRTINTSGIINTIAGNDSAGFFGDGGPATMAELNHPTGVALDPSGNVYIADWYNSRIRRITYLTTGINLPEITDNSPITIYPDPSIGTFTITGIIQGQIIEIYNYTGEKLSAAISDKNTIQFVISNYANGIYLVRILNKDGSVFTTKKVVKME
ncbi:MAG TPA: T9SS type A sorting domain-containing protein [Bacteroidia bacterium]|jgi:sugar lactone lactonase YvrE|nr:T9SS type A sorting domain-containing protein [Bacteroidia bacterium]